MSLLVFIITKVLGPPLSAAGRTFIYVYDSNYFLKVNYYEAGIQLALIFHIQLLCSHIKEYLCSFSDFGFCIYLMSQII